MKIICSILVALVFATGLGPRRTDAQSNTSPQFERAGCPFTPAAGITEGKNLQCGYLTVPEDRSVPGGRTIKLAVAIFKSPEAQTAPDPVIYLAGGPGISALSLGTFIDLSDLGFWTGNRDLILVDQRGTGYSEPSLACPEFTREYYTALSRGWRTAQQKIQEAVAFAACHKRLVGRGINLSAYNTMANAADIADLRIALGYPSVNLYGTSYGSRLALAVMRSFPQGIRSVVLDAVLPPNIDLGSTFTSHPASAYAPTLAACQKSKICNAHYPHLRTVFASVLKRLAKTPPKIKVNVVGTSQYRTVMLTEDVFVTLVVDVGLQGAPLIAVLPDMITRAAQGKYGLAARIANQVGLLGLQSVSIGVLLSERCSEDASFANSPRNARNCRLWNVQNRGLDEQRQVVSAIPTMLMSGEYDTITPPSYAKKAAKTLSHNYVFVYPGMGHGSRFDNPCPYGMAAAFFDNPTAKPDDSCIATMLDPFQ